MAAKIATFVAYAGGVRYMSFQIYPCNKYRDIAEKIHWSSSKLPVVKDQAQLNSQLLERMRGECVV
jgi:hypothetical protein